jgi:putative endonuclease
MTSTSGGRVSLPSPAAAPAERRYYVYILSTPARGLYLGVTSDLARRLTERRLHTPPGAASTAGAARLVYFEVLTDFRRAIARKEQLEGWNRSRRWRMIQSVNPEWRDLAVRGER